MRKECSLDEVKLIFTPGYPWLLVVYALNALYHFNMCSNRHV